jgi:predicted hotdog family 3-hydroxylacyl-ACP dehydratase
MDISALLQQDVVNFIPQRSPMVMLSRVISCNEKEVKTELDIRADNIFTEEGRFSESGMLENIAQTAASSVGIYAKLNNQKVPIGFIGAISKVNLMKNPKVGQVLKTKVETLQQVMNITLISGKCFVEGECCIECQMKIVIDP